MSKIDIKKIKVILLDLGGVVFQSTGTSNEKINWYIISQLNEKYGHDLNIGKYRLSTFLSEYSYLTDQFLGELEFLGGIFDTIEFNKELVDILNVDHDIVIVSDNYRENIEYISQRFKFSEWSIKQVYSYDYQMVKSNHNFFKRLLEELEYDKEELLLIDDSPCKISSAAANGIQGILYKSNDEIALEFID
jgi:FMN phosphatase YigB (HAD superfamily)